MLKIKKINRDEIPQKVWNKFNTDIHFFAFYESKGMFGTNPDYLLVMENTHIETYDEYRCYGYVYNGNAPECSEFGSFGLNKSKTERIW